jgi:hypothetical protein
MKKIIIGNKLKSPFLYNNHERQSTTKHTLNGVQQFTLHP